MYLPFEEMPASARIWIYQSNRPFEVHEMELITTSLVSFCDHWNSHGTLMPTSFDIKYNQFIILAVDESRLGASGCSIDSSVKTLRHLEHELSVNLLDQGKISFIDETKNVIVSGLNDVKNLIQEGKLNHETTIFNPSVNKKQDLEEKWLIPAKESWLKRYFNN